MMYALLNVAFAIPLLLVAYIIGKKTIRAKNVAIVVANMLALTVVFDSLIIAVGIVFYDTDKILGLYIGKAPVEDFAYALVAAVIVPIIWGLYDQK